MAETDAVSQGPRHREEQHGFEEWMGCRKSVSEQPKHIF